MNDVKLQEGHPVDENLRPLKVGGKSTALETAQHGNGARVNGDLEVSSGDLITNRITANDGIDLPIVFHGDQNLTISTVTGMKIETNW